MFAKRLFQKATHHLSQHNAGSCLASSELDLRISLHYGIPSTASILAFDPIQRLLAIGTLDGRIKVIGGDNIEALLVSPQQLPYKYLEFLQNQGFLVSITNENDIQVWNLRNRSLACSLVWDSNITAFSIISGSHFMYVGDEYGSVSVLKFSIDDGQLLRLPYHISLASLAEGAELSLPNNQPIVGVLPQPFSSGNRLLIAYDNGLIILWDVIEARILIVKGDKYLQLKDDMIDSSRNSDTSLVDDSSQHQLEEKEISALEGEKNGHHHMPETRGLCLSEEQTVSTILRRPRIGGHRITDMFTEPYRLIRRCEVTAILILYGLPRYPILVVNFFAPWCY